MVRSAQGGEILPALVHAEVPGVFAIGAEILIPGDGIGVLCGRGIFVGSREEIHRPAGAGGDGNEAGFGSAKTQNDAFVGVVPDGHQGLVDNTGTLGICGTGGWFRGATAREPKCKNGNQSRDDGASE